MAATAAGQIPAAATATAATSSSPNTILTAPIAHLIVQSYSGELSSDGIYTGPGIADYYSGHKYAGHFKDGLLNGYGTYQWFDGVTYEGQFRDNKITAKALVHGLRHGYGRFEYTDRGIFFEGEWLDGKPNGQGFIQYDDTSFYKGKPPVSGHSSPTTTCWSGNVYEGEWRNGVKHGQGKLTWKDRGEEYEGEWKDGKPNGFGVYVWHIAAIRGHQYPMQNRYEGKWFDGKRHGHGVFQYATGAKYDGEWFANMKHGKGTFISEMAASTWASSTTIDPLQTLSASGTLPPRHADTPYKFVIQALSPKETEDETLKQIHAVLFRHMVDLCKIYRYYSSMTKVDPANPKQVMTRYGMWKLFYDIKLVHNGYTIAELDRAYAKAFMNHPQFGFRYNDPHNSHEQFILHDFFEYLMLVAYHVYHDHPKLSIHEHGVAACLSYMIDKDLLPLALPLAEGTRPAPSKFSQFMDIFRQAGGMQLPAINFQELFGARIEKTYDQMAKRRANALPKSAKDKTTTIRETLLTLKLVHMDIFHAVFAVGCILSKDEIAELKTILGEPWVDDIDLATHVSTALSAANDSHRGVNGMAREASNTSHTLGQEQPDRSSRVFGPLATGSTLRSSQQQLGSGYIPTRKQSYRLDSVSVAGARLEADQRFGGNLPTVMSMEQGLNADGSGAQAGSSSGIHLVAAPALSQPSALPPPQQQQQQQQQQVSQQQQGQASQNGKEQASQSQQSPQQQSPQPGAAPASQQISTGSQLQQRSMSHTQVHSSNTKLAAGTQPSAVESNVSLAQAGAAQEASKVVDEADDMRREDDGIIRLIKGVHALHKTVSRTFNNILKAHAENMVAIELVERTFVREMLKKRAEEAAALVIRKNGGCDVVEDVETAGGDGADENSGPAGGNGMNGSSSLGGPAGNGAGGVTAATGVAGSGNGGSGGANGGANGSPSASAGPYGNGGGGQGVTSGSGTD
ncbi:hypothetical protein BC831DRAFT_513918 [Entophlyctis helioformis]|nr:hypothetical protein BC831DRAFT_513918 [Entophlyctis helioformis]